MCIKVYIILIKIDNLYNNNINFIKNNKDYK